jgi:DNA-binding phage protein
MDQRAADTHDEVMKRFAEPFARALAVFVREAFGEPNPISKPVDVGGGGEQFIDLDDAIAEGVAAHMRRIMRRRRITQAQLAERTKLSLGVISRALKDPNRAKVATLRKMATVLDARFADLLQPGSQ